MITVERLPLCDVLMFSVYDSEGKHRGTVGYNRDQRVLVKFGEYHFQNLETITASCQFADQSALREAVPDVVVY